MLQKIDLNTLTVTDVGTIGVSFNFGGLAYDPNNNILYMIDGRASNGLFKVDINTGAATLVGYHNITDLFALEFDPSTGKLFAVNYSGGASQLYTLDQNTGAATLVGPVNFGGIGGLAYDSKRNMLVGIFDGAGDLYSIDRTTGAGTLLYDGIYTDNSGLAYDPYHDKFWDIDYQGRLVSFDPTAGYARTDVLTGLGVHDGLAYIGPFSVPEPGTLALMGPGLVLVGLLRRRCAA